MADFNLTGQITLNGPDAASVSSVRSQISNQLSNIKTNVSLIIDPKLRTDVRTINRDLTRLNTTLQQIAVNGAGASKGIKQLSSALGQLHTYTVRQTKAQQEQTQEMQHTETAMEHFGKLSALAIRRYTAFTAITTITYGFLRATSNAIVEAIKFERELVRVAQVSGKTLAQLSGLTDEISQLSTKWGVSSTALVEVSKTLSQAGLSIYEVKVALDAIAKASLAPTFTDMNQITEGTIAVMRQFKIGVEDVEEVLGSLNAVSAKYAVESDDLITVIRRTGGTFAATAGHFNDGKEALNELMALFTSVRSTTRESAETIATGLRTIFTRMQRPKTIEFMKQFGVSLQDAKGQFIGTYEAIGQINKAISNISPKDMRFAKIIEQLGGFRQVGKVIPLLQQFAIAQEAFDDAQKGSTSITKDAEKAQEALSVQLTKVREDFLALLREITRSQLFKDLAHTVIGLSHALIDLSRAIKPVLPFLALMLGVRAFRGAQGIFKGFKENIMSVPKGSTGGMVHGRGNKDTIPALLTPGEVVLTRDQARSLGFRRGVSGKPGIQKFAKGSNREKILFDEDYEFNPVARFSIEDIQKKKEGILNLWKEKFLNKMWGRRGEEPPDTPRTHARGVDPKSIAYDLGGGAKIVHHTSKTGKSVPISIAEMTREMIYVIDKAMRGSWFYRSFTGASGKKQGDWYPTGGIVASPGGSEAWMIKGAAATEPGYGRPALEALTKQINKVLPHSDAELDAFIGKLINPQPPAPYSDITSMTRGIEERVLQKSVQKVRRERESVKEEAALRTILKREGVQERVSTPVEKPPKPPLIKTGHYEPVSTAKTTLGAARDWQRNMFARKPPITGVTREPVYDDPSNKMFRTMIGMKYKDEKGKYTSIEKEKARVMERAAEKASLTEKMLTKGMHVPMDPVSRAMRKNRERLEKSQRWEDRKARDPGIEQWRKDTQIERREYERQLNKELPQTHHMLGLYPPVVHPAKAAFANIPTMEALDKRETLPRQEYYDKLQQQQRQVGLLPRRPGFADIPTTVGLEEQAAWKRSAPVFQMGVYGDEGQKAVNRAQKIYTKVYEKSIRTMSEGEAIQRATNAANKRLTLSMTRLEEGTGYVAKKGFFAKQMPTFAAMGERVAGVMPGKSLTRGLRAGAGKVWGGIRGMSPMVGMAGMMVNSLLPEVTPTSSKGYASVKGVIGGASLGATMGSFFGPFGMAIGAATGGLLGLAGALKDHEIIKSFDRIHKSSSNLVAYLENLKKYPETAGTITQQLSRFAGIAKENVPTSAEIASQYGNVGTGKLDQDKIDDIIQKYQDDTKLQQASMAARDYIAEKLETGEIKDISKVDKNIMDLIAISNPEALKEKIEGSIRERSEPNKASAVAGLAVSNPFEALKQIIGNIIGKESGTSVSLGVAQRKRSQVITETSLLDTEEARKRTIAAQKTMDAAFKNFIENNKMFSEELLDISGKTKLAMERLKIAADDSEYFFERADVVSSGKMGALPQISRINPFDNEIMRNLSASSIKEALGQIGVGEETRLGKAVLSQKAIEQLPPKLEALLKQPNIATEDLSIKIEELVDSIDALPETRGDLLSKLLPLVEKAGVVGNEMTLNEMLRVTKELATTNQPTIDAASGIFAQRTEAEKLYVSILNKKIKLEDDYIQKENSLIDMKIDHERQIAQLTREIIGHADFNWKDMFQSQFERVGQLTGGTLDPNIINKRILSLQEKIDSKSKSMRYTAPNSDEWKQLAKEMNNLERESNNLQLGLQKLSEVSLELISVRKEEVQVSKEEMKAQRDAMRSLVTEIATAKPQDLFNMVKQTRALKMGAELAPTDIFGGRATNKVFAQREMSLRQEWFAKDKERRRDLREELMENKRIAFGTSTWRGRQPGLILQGQMAEDAMAQFQRMSPMVSALSLKAGEDFATDTFNALAKGTRAEKIKLSDLLPKKVAEQLVVSGPESIRGKRIGDLSIAEAMSANVNEEARLRQEEWSLLRDQQKLLRDQQNFLQLQINNAKQMVNEVPGLEQPRVTRQREWENRFGPPKFDEVDVGGKIEIEMAPIILQTPDMLNNMFSEDNMKKLGVLITETVQEKVLPFALKKWSLLHP